MIEETPFIWTE